ncbi:MAG: radical SAM/SPASM domain-containing protein [Candidatus Helarchaeota archaeon]
MKLTIKPFINSYMLPCSCNEEEWNSLLAQYKTRIQEEPKRTVGKGEILTVRPDGLALLEGPVVKEFRFSRQGVNALKERKLLERKNLTLEEITHKIADTLKVSIFQVEVFFKLVDEWIGQAELKFLDGPTPLPEKYLDAPLLIQWEITAKCNLKCIHCYADTDGEAALGELSKEEALSFIDEVADMGVRGIHFLGGEPFTRPDILELIRKTANRGMFSHISTNGTLISSQIAQELASLDRITVDVSLDGVCPKAHDSFRGVKGTFEKVIQALETLMEANIVLNVTSVLGKHNFGKIEDIMDIAVRYGAKRIQFLTFSPTGRGTTALEKYGFKKKHLKVVRKKILDLIFKYWGKIYIDAPLIGFNLLALRTYEVLQFKGFEPHYDLIVGCNAGITKVAIDYLGNVMPCPQYRTPIGNIRAGGLLSSWQKLHTSFSEKKICPNGDCLLWQFCGGQCRLETKE